MVWYGGGRGVNLRMQSLDSQIGLNCLIIKIHASYDSNYMYVVWLTASCCGASSDQTASLLLPTWSMANRLMGRVSPGWTSVYWRTIIQHNIIIISYMKLRNKFCHDAFLHVCYHTSSVVMADDQIHCTRRALKSVRYPPVLWLHGAQLLYYHKVCNHMTWKMYLDIDEYWGRRSGQIFNRIGEHTDTFRHQTIVSVHSE